MKKIYLADSWGISAYELVKLTEHQVVYKDESGRERRTSKISEYSSFHDSFEEARECLIKKQEIIIDSALKRINYAKQQIEKIKSYETI